MKFVHSCREYKEQEYQSNRKNTSKSDIKTITIKKAKATAIKKVEKLKGFKEYDRIQKS